MAIVYGQVYRIKNGYQRWRGYLNANDSGPYSNIPPGPDGLHCVSTRDYNQNYDPQTDTPNSLWKLLSATGKPDGSPVLSGDIVHIQNQGVPFGQDFMGGFLDTRGEGCQDNFLCVSTSKSKDRYLGSGSWKILINKPGSGAAEAGEQIGEQVGFHLLNGANGFNGGYLDTRGTGLYGDLCLVSTRSVWDGVDDPNTTAWWCEIPRV